MAQADLKGWHEPQNESSNFGTVASQEKKVVTQNRRRLNTTQYGKATIQNDRELLGYWRSFRKATIAKIAPLKVSESGPGVEEIIVEHPAASAKRLGPESTSGKSSDFDLAEIRERFIESVEGPSQNIEQGVYSNAKEVYTDENIELTDNDILNIAQTISYARNEDYEGWIQPLKQRISDYFDDLRIDQDTLTRSVKSSNAISPRRAHEIYQEEAAQIRKAIESVYEDRPEQQREKAIEAEQKEILCKIVSKVNIES